DHRSVELYLFLQRPARRLDHATLDLVADTVRVYDEPGVDRAGELLHPNLAGLLVDVHFGDVRHVGGRRACLTGIEREADAHAGAALAAARAPPGRFGRGVDNVDRAVVLEVAEAVFRRILAGVDRQLIH